MLAEVANREGVLHVEYAYRGFDVPLDRLGVGPAADDRRIKQALARLLVVPEAWLSDFEVRREPEGDLTLRQVA